MRSELVLDWQVFQRAWIEQKKDHLFKTYLLPWKLQRMWNQHPQENLRFKKIYIGAFKYTLEEKNITKLKIAKVYLSQMLEKRRLFLS